jgi:hypothetical protein
MKLELATPEDVIKCAEWMAANRSQNHASLDDLRRSQMLKIEGIWYIPARHVLLLESLAPNPVIDGTTRLFALRRAMEDMRELYKGDLLYQTTGDTQLDKCARSYGFREEKFKYYRLRACGTTTELSVT